MHDKVFQDYRLTFTTRLPGEEEPAGRPSKTSPLYERLKGARLRVHRDVRLGAPEVVLARRPRRRGRLFAHNVFEVVRDEVAAVHQRVGILDLTGFAKYDIKGADAEAFLNRVCANRIPRKSGGIALVHLLSPQGRILGEMTVTRLADDRFYALSAAAAELRDRDWLTQSLRQGERVQIDNVTEDRGVLVRLGTEVARAAAGTHGRAARQRGFSLADGARHPGPRAATCARCG